MVKELGQPRFDLSTGNPRRLYALIVEEILARWETVTHGNEGLMVKPASLFGQPLVAVGEGRATAFVPR